MLRDARPGRVRAGSRAVSFCHSCVYTALLICAFALHNPQPETFIFGLAHGVLWIGMSLVCIAAARLRVIPYWLAVTVAVLGGLGPFAGTIGFIVEQRRRRRNGVSGYPSVDGSQQQHCPSGHAGDGDSVAEGTVLEWHKQEGDAVAGRRDARRDLDRQGRRRGSLARPGTIVKIHAAEGDTVSVGAVLAEISTNGDGRWRNGDVADAVAAGVAAPVRRVSAGDARGGRRRRGHRG